jgi:hypothetical protein
MRQVPVVLHRVRVPLQPGPGLGLGPLGPRHGKYKQYQVALRLTSWTSTQVAQEGTTLLIFSSLMSLASFTPACGLIHTSLWPHSHKV